MTSNRLTKKMYDNEFVGVQLPGLFGIRTGQCRVDDYVHNGGWFNSAGENLGYGDLSRDDIRRISSELQDVELFIVLCEDDASFNLYGGRSSRGISTEGLDPNAPGTSYVVEHAMWIIARGVIYMIDTFEESLGEDILDGLVVQRISREQVHALVAGQPIAAS